MDKEYLSVEQTCCRCGIGRTTMFALLRDREIDSVKFKRRTLIPVASVDAYIARNTRSRRDIGALAGTA